MFSAKKLRAVCAVLISVAICLSSAVLVGAETGKLNANSVNFRKSPSKKGKVLMMLGKGTPVDVVEKGKKWTKVKLISGKAGYVSSEFISVKSGAKKGKKTNRSDKLDASEYTEKLVTYAKKFIGTKYVYGGTSPSGFDCSGLVYYCYRNKLGITLGGRTATQMYHTTKRVKRSNLKPGDLIFFARSKKIYHVAMYVGKGKMIHAELSAGVNIDHVSEYNSTYYAAGRVL